TPGDTGLEEGNLSTHYYILSDDFNENLFSENTYSLNARNLMLLLSGRSSYSQTQVSQITNLLQKSGNSALSKTITPTESTKFSIDPKNNPLWSITGFDITNGDFTTYELGSAVPLVLEAGGDGIAVDKKSIQVELYHLGATPQALTGSTPHITLIQKGTYEDGKLKESLQLDDSFYDFGNGDIGLKVNHYYEIVVTGSDVDGNDLDSKEGRYGFKRYSTFAPPTITFLAGPEESQNLVENNFKSGTTLDAANGVNIFVKVVTASKDISIEGSDRITINSITADNTPISKDNYTYTINNWQEKIQGDAKIYTFTANIKANSGKSLVLGQGTYKYKVSFTAEDSLSGGKNESHDFEFKVDNAKPTISGITLSPRVNKTVNGQSIAYVNGEITVSGNVSDSGSGLPNTIKYGIDTANSSTSGVQTVAVNGTSWSFPYNTLDKTTTSGNCKLYIYAQDLVGNEETQEVTLNIDQDTDTPVINFTNAGNTFTKASNILIGNVTDDDGLKSVEAWYTKTAPVTGSKTKFNLTGFTEGLTSYSINAKLPDEEGEYLIEVVAKDKPGLDKGTNTYPSFTVKKDEGAPVLTVTSPNTNSQTYYPGSLTVKGNVKDGSGKIKTITRTVARKNSTTNISSLTKDIDITS
ncbi:MAG: hypothetical protein IKN54_01950, partial [Lachnospiraceae bacterium]|nr:hypothetical protein [Lachnospiraceae bacterium]